jgi:putative ABC transport system permease protein
MLIRKGQFRNGQGKKTYGRNTVLERGDTLKVKMGKREMNLTIGAILENVYYGNFNETEGGLDIVVSEEIFAELTGHEHFDRIFIRLKPNADKKEITDYLNRLVNIRIGYSYVDVQANADEMTRETQAISLFFYGFITVIALICCLNIINTVSTNLILRYREFGIIQSVGLDRTGLRGMILVETLIYSLTALIAGSLLGTGIWYILIRTLSNIRSTPFTVPWYEIGISAVVLIVITALSGTIPVRRIFKRPIIENIRTEE